jgi:phosphatidylglycerol:prolipoprotein diacylglycerol transferase
MHPIIFPGLGLEFNIDPVAFNILGKDVYWYGIIIAAAFLVAGTIGTFEAERTGLDIDRTSNLILIIAPFAIIGARIFYVLFYPGEYNSFIDVIAIWRGGLAIYGAIITAFVMGFILSKVMKLPFLKIADIASLCFLSAQAIGRWGNFINQEAYGTQTNLPWRMEIFDYEFQKRISVHPTFLYESLWNILGFILLFLYRKKKKFDGEILALYAIWYGIGRFWIEGLRTDSLYLGSFRVSQVVAIVSILIGLILLGINLKKLAKTNN